MDVKPEDQMPDPVSWSAGRESCRRIIRLSADRSRGAGGTARAGAGHRAEGLMAQRLTHRRMTCSDGMMTHGLQRLDGLFGGIGGRQGREACSMVQDPN